MFHRMIAQINVATPIGKYIIVKAFFTYSLVIQPSLSKCGSRSQWRVIDIIFTHRRTRRQLWAWEPSYLRHFIITVWTVWTTEILISHRPFSSTYWILGWIQIFVNKANLSAADTVRRFFLSVLEFANTFIFDID